MHTNMFTIIAFAFIAQILSFKHSFPIKSTILKASSGFLSDGSDIVRPAHPPISADILDKMEKDLANRVSVLAIDTVSTYMLEFRNEILQKWMVQFNNYSTKGFPNDDSTLFIERLIVEPDTHITVIVKPPKLSSKIEVVPPLESGVAISYEFDIG